MSDQVEDGLQLERERLMKYRVVFSTEDGKFVLNDLMNRYLWQDSRPHVASGNQPGIIYIDAQRMLMVSINRWLTMDIDKYMSQFRHPLEMEQGDPLNAGQSTSEGHYY